MPDDQSSLFGRGGGGDGRARGLRALVLAAALAAVVVAAVLLATGGGGPAPAPRTVESIFQDDQLLVYQPVTPTGAKEVQRTLETLKALGVDRIRVTVEWYYLAPDHDATAPPPGFDAADPAAYPAAAWLPYDRVVRLARADGLSVMFTITGPGPRWAMSAGAPERRLALQYRPAAGAFGRFAQAVGRRYSGTFTAAGEGGGPLPRIDFWSIWNEPNQPGWLAPQWSAAGAGAVPASPRLYRDLADAAFAGLARSGHPTRLDTILIGELAPEGSEVPSQIHPMTPMPFVRALYCVDGHARRLTGPVARAAGCPASGSAAAFVRANPALFRATGFAHHPYSFLTAPDVGLSDPNTVPLSELPRLERALDAIFAAYGQDRRLPIYLTEYGYETNPPNPYRGVSPATQARYLNEAEYLAWDDPRVRAMAQFELQDSPPDAAYPKGSFGYWSTFQTGLEFLGGRPKPSLVAYRLPIFLPVTNAVRGGSLLVWGMLRPAPNGTRQTAEIQWRPRHGAFRPLASVTTGDPSGYLVTHVTPPGSGAVRIAWRAPDGAVIDSRAVSVSVG